MERKQTKGIVLRRVNYAEADRIITVITPDSGKVSFIAKGVRRPKSKLAGGIKLFAINDLTLLQGKGELMILAGARAERSFDNIMRDYETVQVAYKVLDFIDKATEDDAPREYYRLVVDTLELLEKGSLHHGVVEGWMTMQFLQTFGNAPNVTSDVKGEPLKEDTSYEFDVSEGNFVASNNGSFGPDEIKAWRVLLASDADSLQRVRGLWDVLEPTLPVLQRFAEYVRK